MRHARRKSGPLIAAMMAAPMAAPVVALAGCRGGPAPQSGATDEAPLLVIEDRGPLVVSGRDTTMVLAPTVFAWFDVESADSSATAAEIDALRLFRQSLVVAQPRLRAMGVRVVPQDEAPVVVELPPGAPDPEAPDAAPETFGYLFIDMSGRMERHDGVVEEGALVCLAALTFGLPAEGC